MNPSEYYKETSVFVNIVGCCMLIDDAYVLYGVSCLLQAGLGFTDTA